MPDSFSQLLAKGRALVSDPLYRGTLLLLVNSGLLAVLGFAFWTLAARKYPASTVGSFSGLNSGIGLVAAVASLGLQNLVTRHIASSKSPRGLLKTVPASSLPGFLRQHYTTSSDMASVLASFLVSNGATDTRYVGAQFL